LEKNHFEFGKKQKFSFVEFRECTFLGKRRGKIKDFSFVEFLECIFLGKRRR